MLKRLIKTIMPRWFLNKSKSYMGYYHIYSKEGLDYDIQRLKFWIKYPISYTKFCYYQIKEHKEYIIYG
jgi:hypothetical protein